MANFGTVHRKAVQVAGTSKADAHPGHTIRVSLRVGPVEPRTPSPLAQAPSVAPAPGLPCSGRCGHCNNHPCLLHGGI